jgi:hypothetical protein
VQNRPPTRKRLILLLSFSLVIILAVLIGLNAFNVQAMNPNSLTGIFVFTGISILVFLLLLILILLLVRNILKLYAEKSSHVLGARLRTRMVYGALLLTAAPAFFMFLYSFLLMNRSIERWFSQPSSQLREDSMRIAMESARFATANAQASAADLAISPELSQNLASGSMSNINEKVRTHSITLQGGLVVLYRDGKVLAQYQLPKDYAGLELLPWVDPSQSLQSPAGVPITDALLNAAQHSDDPVVRIGSREYALGTAVSPQGAIVLVGLPVPQELSKSLAKIVQGSRDYWTLYRNRNLIRTTYFLALLLLTVLAFFISTYLALHLSRQITRPVEALADAMDRISSGDYQHRVAVEASRELADLVASFNAMASDLEQSRTIAESSKQQISTANDALETRRRELETILETIPNGVATLSADNKILMANRAFHETLNHSEPLPLESSSLDDLFPDEMLDDLHRLVRRGQRMGVSSANFELRTSQGTRSLTATAARLDGSPATGPARPGAILVLEDTTEALRTQRQAAWKEVAQRVAHEIKNPLTPISLSAERIRRHLDKNTADSPAVIRKCSEVILSSVDILRTLVDQFAALAQFPVSHPHLCNINQIVESALFLFSGRIDGVQIHKKLEPNLPDIMADPDALKRALANLIDNAAEAMQSSLLRVLTLETTLADNGEGVEIAIADTGHGLTDDMRERLFLPFFSTKQRGTGLGLSIAAKIVQEHNGSIRAEKNFPAGARFIIQLPLIDNAAAPRAAVTAGDEI